jgi:hypothetical protein
MLYGLQELFSRIASDISTLPTHRPGLPPAVRERLLGMLQRGDVMVVRKEHALTNYFLPGYWPHAAMYLGDGVVLESMKDGVWRRPIDSPFASDAIAVLRPALDASLIDEAIARGLTHEGKPYDFDFDFTRSDRMVCTEVVYRSYEGLGGLAFALTPRAGRMTLSAEDLLGMALAGSGFAPLAVYVRDGGSDLAMQDDAAALLKRTMRQS